MTSDWTRRVLSGPWYDTLCLLFFFFLLMRPQPRSTLFPYTTLFRSRLRPLAWPTARTASGDPTWRAMSAYDRVSLNGRSEEHTSELQSRLHLVCRLLLEKKNAPKRRHTPMNKDPSSTLGSAYFSPLL